MANLLAKKPLSLLCTEAEETGEHSLKRTLGVFQLTSLGVGAVIGAGIFVMSGLGASMAGPGLMLSFVLTALVCAFSALCYAEFAAMVPVSGSAWVTTQCFPVKNLRRPPDFGASPTLSGVPTKTQVPIRSLASLVGSFGPADRRS